MMMWYCNVRGFWRVVRVLCVILCVLWMACLMMVVLSVVSVVGGGSHMLLTPPAYKHTRCYMCVRIVVEYVHTEVHTRTGKIR